MVPTASTINALGSGVWIPTAKFSFIAVRPEKLCPSAHAGTSASLLSIERQQEMTAKTQPERENTTPLQMGHGSNFLCLWPVLF